MYRQWLETEFDDERFFDLGTKSPSKGGRQKCGKKQLLLAKNPRRPPRTRQLSFCFICFFKTKKKGGARFARAKTATMLSHRATDKPEGPSALGRFCLRRFESRRAWATEGGGIASRRWFSFRSAAVTGVWIRV